MGGCASRPKDLDLNEPVPVEAPVVEPETVTQEKNGGEETKIEEPLVDISDDADETAIINSRPVEEVAESKVEAAAEVELEVAPAQPVEAANKEAEPEIIEDKPDAPLAPIA